MFDDNRPKITLTKTNTQRYIEIATFACLGLALVYTILNYSALPEQVPMHFNISGEVDNYGDKSFVWFPLVIGFGLCFGLMQLNKHPHLFNYPNKITADNAEKQYSSAIKMMSIINFMVALLLAILSYNIVSLGINGTDKTAKWSEYLMYIILGLMTFGPLIWVIKSAVSPSDK